MTARDVNITILDNGFGGVGNLNDNLVAVIGCGSAGVDNYIVPVTNPSAPINDGTWGDGPLPQAIAHILTAGAGSTALGVKVATTTAGAVVGASASPLTVSTTNTSSPIQVTTTAPHGLVTGDVVTITGVVGQTGANGTRKITKVGATTFTLDGSTSVGAYVSGGSVQPTGVNEYSTGTSVVTVTGSIVDTYDVYVSIVTGGTIGVAGITFQISLDGGLTMGPILALGTASTYATNGAGTLNFAAGTLVAGDAVIYYTSEPLWAVADVLDAIDAVVNSTYDPVGIFLVGKMSSTDFSSLSTALATLEGTNKRYCFLLGNARDYDAGETDAAWMTDILDDFSASESPRISVAAGFYRVPQQSTGTQQRRPLSWPFMGRILENPLQVSPARVKDGSLLGVSAPSDDGYTYHDERNNPGLSAGRFAAAKTILGKPGWFIDQPNVMAEPGSTFSLIMYRRGMDKACRITRATMLDYLSAEVRIDPDTGYILEVDAATIEAVLNSALETGLVAPGNVSSASAHVSRTDNLLVTSTLNVTVSVVPLAYLATIDVQIGFINPALALG